MTDTYLVTGATGFVGSAFVRQLYTLSDGQILCLVRDARPGAGAQKLRRILAAASVPFDDRRITAIAGDVRSPGLALSESDRHRVVGAVTHVVHSAALVGFLQPADLLEEINLRGTANVLALALACREANPRFHCYAHLSTAYVAGRRTDLVREADLSDGHGFRNEYEASKFAAERLVREATRRMPALIFRPSIVIGPANAASPSAGHSLSAALRLMSSNRNGLVAVNRRCPVDFVPVDYVAKAMYALLQTDQALGRSFHLVSGGQYPLLVEDYIRIINEVARRGMAPIRVLPPWMYRYMLAPLFRRQNNPIAKKVVRFADAYLPYFISNPRFDDSEAQEVLRSAGVEVPNPLNVFRRILNADAERTQQRVARRPALAEVR